MNQTRRLVSWMLIFCLAFCLLIPARAEGPAMSRFSRTEMGIFDTVIQLLGYAETQQDFDRAADGVMELLREYNQVFDAYNDYGDLHNLKYVNAHAAQAPVEVPDALFDLLTWCFHQWEAGHQETNIAMGAVLSIWHEYRNWGLAHPQEAALPPMEELRAAAEHIRFEDVILDVQARTVFFADPLLQLDLGAVAKGYAADAARAYLDQVMPSFLLSLGGNVYAGEKPADPGRATWTVGVQDPRAEGLKASIPGTDLMDILEVNRLTVVTSGDYWRYYTVDGRRYHHIIDPDTLMPSTEMLSVTVVCESSTLADYLSTTLFILSYEDGLALVEQLSGVDVLWVLPDSTIRFTPGMARYARSLK